MASATAVSAADIYVQVGGNTSTNASLVFQPQLITAVEGDIVFFNCTSTSHRLLPYYIILIIHHTTVTMGNHTVTQSTFASPCIPAHDTNSSINGFDSGFRDTVNGTAITILSVPITADIANTTLWFFDYNTCGEGGVGGINPNQSSLETLAGFQVSLFFFELFKLFFLVSCRLPLLAGSCAGKRETGFYSYSCGCFWLLHAQCHITRVQKSLSTF